MSGLNLQHKAAEEGLSPHADPLDADPNKRHPSLYVVANILMLCVLGLLVYGLVRIL